jgi:alpha-amylase
MFHCQPYEAINSVSVTMFKSLWRFKSLWQAVLLLGLFSLSFAIAVGTVEGVQQSPAQQSPAQQSPVQQSPVQPADAVRSPAPVFVHLFEWQWEDVAQECENFLAPNGYGAVQISPAMEHVMLPELNYPWWQRYQPVSYKLISRSGDRTQFAAMIQRCHAAGIKLYADAVINHMAALNRGVGSAGSRFSKYDYPGLYQPPNFHTCKKNIADYRDRHEVLDCELVGLADLKTESAQVQQRIADYLIDLVHLGIDGFRIDAAKHIDSKDIAAILQRVNAAVEPDPYIYQEVIDPGNEAIRKNEYYANGNVIEFEYGRVIGEKFLGINGQTLSQLQTLGESWGLMPSEKAIVFLDNHDKQRGHGGGGTYLTYKDGKLYDLASLFMLAFPYGTPQVMSSYAFTDPNQGPPADGDGKTNRVYESQENFNRPSQCDPGWVCEHRRAAIAAMVGFHNQVPADAPLTDWWSNGNQIAFGRSSSGFVVINREAQLLTRTFQTSLSEGIYCDITTGELTADRQGCTGETIRVDSRGQAQITVGELSAIAIHPGARVKA